MKIVLFDYGAGNLHSLGKALERPGDELLIETDPRRAAAEADMLVLPGVGAFGSATARLAPGRDAMRDAIARGLPTIGICLGMQLLFDGSDEGEGLGLGVIPGPVTRLRARRVPQIGWNDVTSAGCDPLFDRAPLPVAYFANSFVCRPQSESCVTAWTTHDGDRFPAAVRVERTVGVQFHPEKSSADGVRFLHAFVDDARDGGHR
ncbi:MAG: imidazole glycerol phosphate synthase subunit HisH [Gemmatimonadaceae bacterium]|nr:imidazole glycerol phosphate synthase subunit HisH [Gemmatimonadaceae bacterium]